MSEELRRKLVEVSVILNQFAITTYDKVFISTIRDVLEKNDINYNGKNSDDWSLLHYCIRSKMLDLAKMLIDEGIDIEIKNWSGTTPLMLSVLDGNIDMVRLLLSKGAKINVRNKDGLTIMDIAKNKCYFEILSMLEDALLNETFSKALSL